MFLERDKRRLHLRLVFAGPPLSGKTETIYRLADQLMVDDADDSVSSPQEARGRTLYFDWATYHAGSFRGHDLYCQIVTVPGQDSLVKRREILITDADAVIFVADSQPDATQRNRESLDELRPWLARGSLSAAPIVFQLNKRDLPDALPVEELCAALGLDDDAVIAETSAISGDGLRRAFVLGVRAAVHRAQQLLDSDRLPEGRPPIEDADGLLLAMQELEGSGDPSQLIDDDLILDVPTGDGDSGPLQREWDVASGSAEPVLPAPGEIENSIVAPLSGEPPADEGDNDFDAAGSESDETPDLQAIELEPVELEPVELQPIELEPFEADLPNAENTESDPVESEMAEADAAESEPEEPESDQPGSDEPEHVSELVEPESVEAEAVDLESAEPEPVESESVNLESVAEEAEETAQDSGGPDIAEPDPVEYEADEPESSEDESDALLAEAEHVELESTELESDEAEPVELESIELESIELESDEPESLEFESGELETDEPESVELESVEFESDDTEFLELEPVELASDESESVELSSDEAGSIELESVDRGSDETEHLELESVELATDESESVELASEEAGSIEFESVDMGSDETEHLELEPVELATDESESVEPASDEANSDDGTESEDRPAVMPMADFMAAYGKPPSDDPEPAPSADSADIAATESAGDDVEAGELQRQVESDGVDTEHDGRFDMDQADDAMTGEPPAPDEADDVDGTESEREVAKTSADDDPFHMVDDESDSGEGKSPDSAEPGAEDDSPWGESADLQPEEGAEEHDRTDVEAIDDSVEEAESPYELIGSEAAPAASEESDPELAEPSSSTDDDTGRPAAEDASPPPPPPEMPPQPPHADLPDDAVWPRSSWLKARLAITEFAPPPYRRKGEWQVRMGGRWYARTYADCDTPDLGRESMNALRQRITGAGLMLSSGRCVVMTEEPSGRYRVWQVVCRIKTLNQFIATALSGKLKLNDAALWLVDASAVYLTARRSIGERLPVALASLGREDRRTVFADFLPTSDESPPSGPPIAGLERELRGLITPDHLQALDVPALVHELSEVAGSNASHRPTVELLQALLIGH